MTTLTEGTHSGEFIVSEANVGGTGVSRSRDGITILSGEVLVAGAVLGIVTASGKFAEYDNAAADGLETAAGILLDAVDATAGDTAAVALVRDFEFHAGEVTWKSGASQGDIDAGTADLKAVGAIAR